MDQQPLGSFAALKSRPLHSLLAATLACVAIGCSGGGGGGSTGTTSTPKVATVTVTPPSASVVFGATLQLSASAATSAGAPVTGLTTSWSSSASNVASVSTTGLVTGMGPGTATITAAMGGVNGNAPLTVVTVAFSPTTSTSLGGTQRFASLNIPAGVTLTAASDLNLMVDSAATVSGTITGNCVMLHLTVAGPLTATGNITNKCATGSATPPDLRIVSPNYSLTDTIRAAGNLLITNDTTLTTAAVLALQQSRAAPASAARAGRSGGIAAGTITVPQGCSVTGDLEAAAGINGVSSIAGLPGTNGGTVTLKCSGDLLFTGTANGGVGGDGGDGSDQGSNPAPSAVGGKGGIGGAIYLSATGSLLFGAAAVLHPGSGGKGGSATASSTVPGASATATGGAGGAAGLNGVISLTAAVKINTVGTVQIYTPYGGRGGDATATGSDGTDAAAGAPAQKGGAASATAGDAGSSYGSILFSAPNTSGAAFSVNSNGSNRGGQANATGGSGGKGDAINVDGAKGGAVNAVGGAGETTTMLYLGNLAKNGGDGGQAFLSGGSGGAGTPDCVAGAPSARGGNGGGGGSASGHGGTKGAGFVPGLEGSSTVTYVGNGANGRQGVPPGSGGSGGVDLRTGVNKLTAVTSFTDGSAGPSCTIASINGTYTGGDANLESNSAAPGPLVLTNGPTGARAVAPSRVNAPFAASAAQSLPTCQGSSANYGETITINVNSAGVGTVTMIDAPTFPRVYNATATGSTITATASFSFFGATIPSAISLTVTGNTLTFVETTVWGTGSTQCANTYGGTLTKQ